MSVPKSKRNISDFEFFRYALQLNKEITFLVVNNFNVKKISKKLDITKLINDMTQEDASIFMGIVEHYNKDIDEISKVVPHWLINHKREVILNLCEMLINYIISANSIYPTCIEEYNERRLLQDKAIGCCRALLTQFQIITYVLNGYVKVDKYKRYIDMVNQEIRLLKGWRAKGNKFLTQIVKK